MVRPALLLAISFLAASALGADDAAKYAGEWQTTRGPLTLEAKGNDLIGRLVFWKLPVKGSVQEGKLVLQYDEGPLHFDAKLDVDPKGRSFTGMALASNGSRGPWQGWRFDPAAAQGNPADFAGLWLTDLGLMELKRTGSKYTGRYALRGTSSLAGEARGRHLGAHLKSARWTGPVGFDLDEAGTNLFGAGGTDGMAAWYAWNGRKASRFARNAPLVAGQMVDGSTEGLLTYTVRAPETYRAGDPKKWPVVLILHGSNMNGRAYVNTIASTWPDIARDYILLGINGETPSRLDPENPAFNYTYTNYMGRSTYQGLPFTDRESPALVREAMDELKAVYPIKHYLVGGHSQGGYLAYSLLMHSPEVVAGAFPIAAEVLIQNEPAVFADATLKASQRAVPLAIIHGRTDPNVAFSSATYAAALFLDAGWPAVRLFADDKAGHMFGLLPVGPAIRWLETLTSDNPAVLLGFAERRFREQAPRDALAALRRVQTLSLDAASQARFAKLSDEINALAGPQAKTFVAAMRANQKGAPADSGIVLRRRLEEMDRFDPSSEHSMNASTFDAMTPLQRTIVERALILAQGLEATALSAPDGQIIDRCETLLLADGRDFLRQALEETLRDRVEALEKKGRPAEPAPAARPAATRGGRRGR